MAFPIRTPGFKFNLYQGDGGGSEQFTFVCMGTTLGIDETVEMDDNMEQDCANPLNLPQKVSTPKSESWSMQFSGRMEASTYQTVRAKLGAQTNWKVKVAGMGAEGGGEYAGAAYLEKLSLNKNENSTVTVSGTLNGQKLLVFTANP